MNWNLSVDVNWLIDVNYSLGNGGNLHCFNGLYFDLIRNPFLYLHIFWNLDYFLHYSLRAWNGLEYLNYDLNRFLYDYLLYYLFRDYRPVPLNLTIPIFQESSENIQLHFEFIFWAVKGIQLFLKIVCFLFNILVILQL